VADDLTRSGDAVLVADDSMTILAMVSARLGRAGYDVTTATRGDEALRLAEELRPRLVVLDVEMPGMDGVEVARRLRTNAELAGVRIILLTSHTDPNQIAAGIAAGADAYITKPFSPQELEVRIDELLGRR
jgi:DNA-binding response OmpR family regulator